MIFGAPQALRRRCVLDLDGPTRCAHSGSLRQAVLDLLSPKSPPGRPLEVMIVGSIGETALHQVLAAFAIAPRSRAVGLGTRSI
jgi:hypothetical protein